MADQFLEEIQTTLEGQIDFHGQRLAELITNTLLIATGIIAFLVGFLLQDVYLSLYAGLLGTGLTFVIVVPPWPFFNQNPLRYIPRGSSATAKAGVVVDGQVIG